MSICILCNQNDQVALSLFNHLEKGPVPVSMITAEQLIFARSWKHEMDSDGKCQTEIVLQNGQIIHSNQIKAVFNRIRYLQMPHFLDQSDRNYAEMEMFALLTSFLKSIEERLFDPLQNSSLLPGEENPLFLRQQAVRAGFPVLDYHFTTAPRWQRSENHECFAPQKNTAQSFYKKSPHLVWQNQPALFMEAPKNITKIIFAGDSFTGEVADRYSMEIKMLSKYINKKFFELFLAETPGGYKFSGVNQFPLFADTTTVSSLARFIQHKIYQ